MANRVRQAVREAVAGGLGAAEIARRMGVSAASVYDFIAEGSTLRPYRRTLAQYERALSEVDESRKEPASAGAREQAEAGGPPGDGTAGTITLSRDDVFYLRGAVDLALPAVQGVAETLLALRGVLERAVGGIEVASRVLPIPDVARPRISPEELRGREDRRDDDQQAGGKGGAA